jgi:ACR3 family arsenite transporter
VTRAALERHQVWIYLAAILAGFACGAAWPALAEPFELALWPVLGLLLYATFTQVPIAHLPGAARDGRFLAASLIGNFVAVPLVVLALLQLLPADPALRLGVLLVLLVPCTDWFVTFTQLAGGDVPRAIALTPINLALQLLLLPVYLWLLLGAGVTVVFGAEPLLAFLLIVVLPLALAWLTERRLEHHPAGATIALRLALLPVPLLALVVFLIAASQVHAVAAASPVYLVAALVFVLFLVAALVLARLLAGLFGLDPAAGRTLAFSLGTRNSFVVLPLALAFPAGLEAAAMVIVLQALVELLGMIAYLRIVPRLVFPAAARPGP